MRDRSFYDEAYFDGEGKSNYREYTFNSSPFEQHADAIAEHMSKNKLTGAVLDVGCAKGYLVSVLRSRGIRAFGVDWSAYALKKARPDVRRYLFFASAVQLPFIDDAFALTVTHDVLEHMDEPNARRALRECARVSLRQLHQVNTDRLPCWHFDEDDSHELVLELPEWKAVARELGLSDTTTLREPQGCRPSVPCSADCKSRTIATGTGGGIDETPHHQSSAVHRGEC
jgi:SAM-dependent methyltransferase